MTRFALIFATVFLAAPAPAQEQPQASPESAEEARAQVLECAGEKFVFAWGAGARPTKVTLCSEAGATTRDVIRMLEDAAAKIDASAIPEDRRTAIVQQIRGKIAQLEGKAIAELPRAESAPTASAPAPVGTPAAVAPAPGPAPLKTAPPVARPSAVPVQAKPRLRFECYTPGEIGSGGPCTVLGRETRLTVHARDPLMGGVRLRFLRNREARAEIALGEMRKGQTATVILPRDVCAGVVESEAEIMVVRGGEVLDSAGPFLLRC